MPCLSNHRRRTSVFHRLAACTGFAIALTFAGCGGPGDRPELGAVTGTITKNGIPLAQAWVEFDPEKGRLSAGRTDAEGRYSLQYTHDAEGAVVGAHTVKIGTGGQPSTSHGMAARNDAGGVRKQLYEKNGVTVDSGENTLDFDITEGNEYKEPADTKPPHKR